jgi:hypothetical protein
MMADSLDRHFMEIIQQYRATTKWPEPFASRKKSLFRSHCEDPSREQSLVREETEFVWLALL